MRRTNLTGLANTVCSMMDQLGRYRLLTRLGSQSEVGGQVSRWPSSPTEILPIRFQWGAELGSLADWEGQRWEIRLLPK